MENKIMEKARVFSSERIMKDKGTSMECSLLSAYDDLLTEVDRVNAQIKKYREALEFISDIYDHEASTGQNSMAAYEAQNMARSALLED